MSNGFAINPALKRIANSRGGLAGSGGATFTRGTTIFHRLNVPVAGQQSFTFFNAPRAAGITNLEQPGTLPVNTVALVRNIRFSFLPGFNNIGQRLGITGSLTQAQIEASLLNVSKYGTTAADPAAASSAPALWQEKARELLSQGTVNFRVGERDVVTAYGLTKFPEGRGVVGDVTASSAIANTTTTTVNVHNQVFASIYNGAPVIGNAYSVRGDVQIGSGQQFGIEVTYANAVDFTQQYAGPLYNISGAITAGVLMCELDIDLSTPAQ